MNCVRFLQLVQGFESTGSQRLSFHLSLLSQLLCNLWCHYVGVLLKVDNATHRLWLVVAVLLFCWCIFIQSEYSCNGLYWMYAQMWQAPRKWKCWLTLQWSQPQVKVTLKCRKCLVCMLLRLVMRHWYMTWNLTWVSRSFCHSVKLCGERLRWMTDCQTNL